MHTFKAKFGERSQTMLVRRNMQLLEFTNALQVTLDLPSEASIVGFRDSTGQVMPASMVCFEPEFFVDDTYEVIIKQNSSTVKRFPTAHNISEDQQPQQVPQMLHQNNSELEVVISEDVNPLGHNGVQELPASHRVSSITPNYLDSSAQNSFIKESHFSGQKLQKQSVGGVGVGVGNSRRPVHRAGSQANVKEPQQFFQQNQQAADIQCLKVEFQPVFHDNYLEVVYPQQYQQQQNVVYSNQICGIQDEEEEEIISLVMSIPSDDLLTDKRKRRLYKLIKKRDKGVLGSYMLFQDDQDFDGFRARLINKVTSTHNLLPVGGGPGEINIEGTLAEQTQQQPSHTGTSSSATTAGFQNHNQNNIASSASRYRGPTPNILSSGSQGLQQSGVGMGVYQPRYLPIVTELEQKHLLDDNTSSIIKTFILEDNVDIKRVLNSFIAGNLTEKDLSFSLTRLAQHLESYLERPQSPMPKRKQELMELVNSLARYHFDPEDVQLLQKLIQQENEFVMGTFDVFESDKDRENMIDSLQRIVKKERQRSNGLQSFFSEQQDRAWQRSAHKNLTGSQQFKPPSKMIHQVRATTPTAQHRPRDYHRMQIDQESNNQQQPFVRQYPASRRLVNNSASTQHQPQPQRHQFLSSHDVAERAENNDFFQPQTTVHDVVVIPNYFSSGEEDLGQISSQPVAHATHHYYQEISSSSAQRQRMPVYSRGSLNNGRPPTHPQPPSSQQQHHVYEQFSPTTPETEVNRPMRYSYYSSSQQQQNQQRNPSQVSHLNASSTHNAPEQQNYIEYHHRHHPDQQHQILVQDSSALHVRDPTQMHQQTMYHHAQTMSNQTPTLNQRTRMTSAAQQHFVNQHHPSRTRVDSSSKDTSQYYVPIGQKMAQQAFGSPHQMQQQVQADYQGDLQFFVQEGTKHQERRQRREKQGRRSHNQRRGQPAGGERRRNRNGRHSNQHHNHNGTGSKWRRNQYSETSQSSSSHSSSYSDDSYRPVKASSRRGYSSVEENNQYTSGKAKQPLDSDSGSSSSSSSFSRKESELMKLIEKMHKKEKNKKRQKKEKAAAKKGKANKRHEEKRRKSLETPKMTPTNQSEATSKQTENLTNAQIVQIIEKETKNGQKLRSDAWILLKRSLNEGISGDIRLICTKFVENLDSEFLLSRLLAASESMIDSFFYLSFATRECGELYKLRSTKSVTYHEAFKAYKQGCSMDQLVQNLKEIVEEEEAKQEPLKQQYLSKNPNQSESGGLRIMTNFQNTNSVNNNANSIHHNGTSGLDQQTKQNGSGSPNVLLLQSLAEKREDIFGMAYQTDFINAQEGDALHNAFFNENDERICALIDSYNEHKDYLRLKSEMLDLGQQLMQNEPESVNLFPELAYGLAWFTNNQQLSTKDQETLSKMHKENNKKLSSIWAVYVKTKNQNDLLDNLKSYLRVLARKQSQPQPQPQQQQQTTTTPNNSQQVSQHHQTESQQQPQQLHNQSRQSQLFFNSSSNQQQAYKKINEQSESDENETQKQYRAHLDEEITAPQLSHQNKLSQHKSGRPAATSEEDQQYELDSSQQIDETDDLDQMEEEEEDDHASAYLEDIKKYSHKILRKYVVNGMISFHDGPDLHNLVSQRDIRIFCIMEVYSQNKNEDDFLENLGLLSQVLKEQQSSVEETPNQLQKNSEDDFFADSQNNGANPLLEQEQPPNSSQIVEEKQEKVPNNTTSESNTLNDSFAELVSTAVSTGQLPKNVADFGIKEKAGGNKKVKILLAVFKKEKSVEDFANSLKRLYCKATGLS